MIKKKKKNAIWLADSTLGHNWRSKFFRDIGFLYSQRKLLCTIFRIKDINYIFDKKQQKLFWMIFFIFSSNFM